MSIVSPRERIIYDDDLAYDYVAGIPAGTTGANQLYHDRTDEDVGTSAGMPATKQPFAAVVRNPRRKQ